MGPLRVLIVDDHPVVRRGMGALLGSFEGVTVVAEAATGAQALREAHLTRPDVVVMDLAMPELDGVEATRRLLALLPDTAVLVVTMFEDDDTLVSAIRAGARGYLLKGADQDEILAALRSVAAGHLVVGPGVAARLVGRLDAPAPPPAFPGLTPREHDILARLARGLGNAAIAADLGLAPKTIANHISTLLTKLGVTTRAEATALARQAGLSPHPTTSSQPKES
ncbi:response regulator transcription factor [Actinocorallia sp. A-T 12471]|uniref:response regulator transcription factor n=1 Tax=Actinocorallia sp. A-T 12471 TaxID=3089813 RepID=UPI0029CE56D2|nr:response regulator transcription factor [Actinocorallia sp. A-T 12471]MDX6743387.1 response regulator transcription factor [Actinocorallia sp. A-T 12471]